MSAQIVAAGRRARARHRGIAISVLVVAIVGRLRGVAHDRQHVLRPRRRHPGDPRPDRARAHRSRWVSCGSRARRSACSPGFAFGIAGVTFQTMLRNPLASPDIIGISSGASAAAVFGIVVLALDETGVSLLALGGALADRRGDLPALEPRRLRRCPPHPHRDRRRGDARQRRHVRAVESRDVGSADGDAVAHGQPERRDLAGRARPSPSRASCCVPLLLVAGAGARHAAARRRHGGEPRRQRPAHAASCSSSPPSRCSRSPPPPPVRSPSSRSWPARSRPASSGPAARCCCRPGSIGALLVLVADLVGQFAFDTRYPVGVITGVLGAPYLIYLLIRTNRSGGSL